MRTADELAEVLERDPFTQIADDPSLYQISLLSGDPDPSAVAEIEAAAVPPERVAVHGREIYAWHPNGIARSQLAKLITGPRLGVQATARNWRTLTRLLER